MSSGIFVIQPNEIVADNVDGMKQRSLANRSNGSERISFDHATIPDVVEAEGVVYKGHDELAYIIKGKIEIGFDCELNPRGPRPNGPPIMIGTNNGSPRMQGIAARYADMWNIFFDITSNKAQGFIDVKPEFDKACRDQGRDLASFGATVSIMVADSTADPWWDRLPVGDVPPILPLLSADPQRVAEDLAAYEAAGASHVQISLDPTTPASIEALAPALEALDRLSN